MPPWALHGVTPHADPGPGTVCLGMPRKPCQPGRPPPAPTEAAAGCGLPWAGGEGSGPRPRSPGLRCPGRPVRFPSQSPGPGSAVCCSPRRGPPSGAPTTAGAPQRSIAGLPQTQRRLVPLHCHCRCRSLRPCSRNPRFEFPSKAHLGEPRESKLRPPGSQAARPPPCPRGAARPQRPRIARENRSGSQATGQNARTEARTRANSC